MGMSYTEWHLRNCTRLPQKLSRRHGDYVSVTLINKMSNKLKIRLKHHSIDMLIMYKICTNIHLRNSNTDDENLLVMGMFSRQSPYLYALIRYITVITTSQHHLLGKSEFYRNKIQNHCYWNTNTLYLIDNAFGKKLHGDSYQCIFPLHDYIGQRGHNAWTVTW